MRNILAYPVTYNEAIDVLNRFKETCDPDLIGDMRPTVCDWIIERLTEQEISTQELEE